MEKTVRSVLAQSLSNLEKKSLKRFKINLSEFKIKKEFNNVPRGKLEEADADDIADLIRRYYGDDYGMEVTLAVLEDIDERKEAETLRRGLQEDVGNNYQERVSEEREASTSQQQKTERTEESVQGTTTGGKIKNYEEFLVNLGMEKYKNSKLTMREVLSIGLENLNNFKPNAISDLPKHFLRNIIALDGNARKTELYNNLANPGSSVDDDLSGLFETIHPLDVLCTVLNCSDKCLQQEIVSRMSMCQFAVPLLLPLGDGSGCTFMLWAMRDIVKKWRPQSLADSKGFREDNVVNIEMPIFSFVRLGPNKLSKSKVLNQILNPTHQHQDFFIHDNMEGGNIERKISDGLVEMSWYFPCGKSDVFSEPIAVANLRGDLESNREQFTFLTRISSAIFIFIESMSENQLGILSSCDPNDTKFHLIITPGRDKAVDPETKKHIQTLIPRLKIGKTNVIKSSAMNDADFMSKIQKIIDFQIKYNSKGVILKDITKDISNLNINVDEDSSELKTTRVCALIITSMTTNVEMLKNQSLTLQGDLLKQFSKLQLCRLTKRYGKSKEIYQSELKKKQNSLLREQYERALPYSMMIFIEAITHLSKDEKQHFLKWMKFELDSIARENVSKLQTEYKEKCNNPDVPANHEELKELDKRISESSLGIEHFLRELGQIYEAEYSTVKNESDKQFSHLPGTAADLLLDGFPLELIDGDASNIPLQWITDVLTELDKKTGGQCRMRVITVLGVQRTGKSTLLNTMFGLQFPVASGRCTRGAFMTLIKVKENFQEEIGCEFILVIDTEGLKAPELSSLDDSYEHDNELATLVVGLSDITIVNMAMENTTEMKVILQIVVHAFLRMKGIGKKPNCQFVHQNVSDVSAHDNNMRERILLEQLDKMTKLAAKMERKSGFDKFSDIMDYDLDKHNWYIPGLWQGVPPMAPVNSGYSEHVSELKKYLLQFLKKQKQQHKASTIPDFCEWLRSLWNYVKYDKFIFSFRNSLVAEAYNKLTMQFTLWEWNFTKEVHEWVVRKETNIKNQPTQNCEENKDETYRDLDRLLNDEEKKTLDLVEKYYESKTENINLIERYREEFTKSVRCLKNELRRNARDKYEKSLSIQKGNLKIQDMKKRYQVQIEEKTDELLKTCREKNNELSDKEVESEFNAMWDKTLSDLQIEKLERRNVSDSIIYQLRQDMSKKGPDINEALLAVKELTIHSANFKVDDKKHIDKKWYKEWWNTLRGKSNEPYEKLQKLSTSLIEKCDEYVTGKENTEEDYDVTYCQEMLQMINTKLDKESEDLHFTAQFELDIKLFIFGKTSKRFQQIHDRFITANDPKTCMDNLKPDYLTLFLDVYKAKDESQNRGRKFCETCLTPAITDYVYDHLGRRMVDDILHGPNNQIFKQRSFFQYNLLQILLDEMNFEKYVKYILQYEKFSKDWIQNKISEIYQDPSALEPLQEDLIRSIIKEVTDILREDTILKSENIPQFLENVQEKLHDKLVIPQTAMQIISFQNKVNVRQFSSDIQTFLDLTKQQVLKDLRSMRITSLLSKIILKPQDELSKIVIGCGHQCPFCRVPCEAGGAEHKHFASIHRPQGLGQFIWDESKKLVTDICTTSVVSSNRFRNSDTDGESHPYKEYRTIYPDWIIQPDPSLQSSDYWKYIFAQFNKEFAEEYNTKPADLPDDWKKITKEDALTSLKKTFYM